MAIWSPVRWCLRLALVGMLAACSEGTAQRQQTGAASPSGSDAPASPPDSAAVPDAAVPDAAASDAGTPSPQDEDARAPSAPPLASACGAGSAPGRVDAQQLFDWPHVPTFDFHLPDEEWASLKQNARDERYVEATACFEDQLIGTVGLRFKGYYGSLFGCFDENDELICSRLSLKVKFHEYVEDQRFFGLKRLNFNAYRHDDSRIKERLTYDLFRAMGIVAPRAAWAVVRVNGESQGLYGMVEQIDGRFTANRWPEVPDGNLYKEIWPTETDELALLDALRTNEDVADVGHFQDFAQALLAASDDDALATLGKYMDPTYLARYMAVDDAVANYDGVTYFWTDGTAHYNHNFYIYEQGPESFVLLPWDVEASFWINPAHAAPHWTEFPDDCTQTYPYWDGLASAPGCNAFFRALGADLDAWRTAARELLDGPFALDAMLANIDRHVAMIESEALADPTPPMYSSFTGAVVELRRTIPRLRDRLEGLLGE